MTKYEGSYEVRYNKDTQTIFIYYHLFTDSFLHVEDRKNMTVILKMPLINKYKYQTKKLNLNTKALIYIRFNKFEKEGEDFDLDLDLENLLDCIIKKFSSFSDYIKDIFKLGSDFLYLNEHSLKTLLLNENK